MARKRGVQKWADLPIARKGAVVLVGALLPLLVAIGLLAANGAQLRRIDTRLPVERQYRLNQTQLLKLLVDAESGVRGYLLAKDSGFLEPHSRARGEIPLLLRTMDQQQRELKGAQNEDVEALVDREMELLASLVELPKPAVMKDQLDEAKRTMDEIRSLIKHRAAVADQRITDLVNERESLYQRGLTLVGGGMLVGLLAAVAGGRMLLRGVVHRVRMLRANAQRLAEGEPLMAHDGSKDEIGDLGALLSRTAHLLRARESALRQAKEEADRANTAKSEFLSRMSHELRTPLNAILGFAQLARNELQGDVRDDVDQIHLAGRHLLDLINEVLDISRIEAGELSLSLEPVSVPELFAEAIPLVQVDAKGRDIEIVSRFSETSREYAYADKQRLKQVLVNLLSNAVKYNRTGGSVTIGCEAGPASLKLIVADTGPGLPEAAADRLFTPFARLGAETSEIEGTGLGLALSQSLVQAMGGDLVVGATSAEGTEFWVTLRRAEPPEYELEVADEPAQLPVDSTAGRGATILQVEDNPSNVRLVSRILQRRPGVELVTTQLGEEAIRLAGELQPALVLLDLNLPDISGHDVITRLRSEPATRDLPIVMLSADATQSQIKALLNAGAADYLTKPIDIGKFLEVIDQALTKAA